MRRLGLSLPVPIRRDVEQLVIVLARALRVRALGDMHVDDAYHSRAVACLTIDAIWKVTHVVDLNKGLNIDLELVHVLLHQLLNPGFSQVAHQEDYQGDTRKDNDNMSIDLDQLH